MQKLQMLHIEVNFYFSRVLSVGLGAGARHRRAARQAAEQGAEVETA
jgi:hypothetical protein